MTRLYVLVEGQTEEAFAKQILGSASLGIWAEGRALTSKGSACTLQRLEC